MVEVRLYFSSLPKFRINLISVMDSLNLNLAVTLSAFFYDNKTTREVTGPRAGNGPHCLTLYARRVLSNTKMN